MSAIGTCVQAGCVPALEQPGRLALVASSPSQSSLLRLCPELIPQGTAVLSVVMEPDHLSPLHKRKNLPLLGESPGVN